MNYALYDQHKRPTAYGLSLGYIQRETVGQTQIVLEQLNPRATLRVTIASSYSRQVIYEGGSLAKARRLFRKARKAAKEELT